ncbi:Transcriptional regulator, MerR family [hydrothermal vent metagenome]|uniref:Transcriptional regulator, MerR family n=1 Tax=hydrothermal vent metagenome TaxID=652676 RepID=A0A3B1BUT3_9ZZZZ
MKNDFFTIGKLSKQAGCVVQTIRYYEKVGLLPKPHRSPRGHRLYNEDILNRLKFIIRTRQLGFNIKERRQFLELVDGGNYTCQKIRQKTLLHTQEIKRKIKDLKKMERELLKMTDKCNDGNGTDCSILATLFRN